MAFEKEYKEMWDVLTKGMRTDEKASFENIMRGYTARGLGASGISKEVLGELREKTARAEEELGVKLGFRQAGERFGRETQVRGEEGALKRLRIGEEGAQKRLDKQLKAAEERMKWQWEQQKQAISSAAKKKRRAGFAQLGTSMVGGGLMSLATPGVGFGTGMLIGMPGMSDLIGQKIGAGFQQDSFAQMMKAFLSGQSSLQGDWMNLGNSGNSGTSDFNTFSFD